MLRGLLVAALLAGAPAYAQKPGLLLGWQRPTETELSGPSADFRKDRADAYLRADGDFDADGVRDRAEILVNRKSGAWALFVFLHEREPLKLQGGDIEDVGQFGISRARPGMITMVCPKSDPLCDRGRPQMDLAVDGIDFFAFEAASSLFFWKDGKFARVWTGD